ncbi:protein RSI-1-like [Primulina huaijiensis]|uniref:protein RSI-1-like n=1 Tax=Primulina huaijiensis TaxID=1492673 RepID=UPI003CC6E973
MGSRTHSTTTLFLVLSLVFFLTLSNVVQGYNHLRPQDCKPRCTYRCSATSHKKPCMFFCLKCCTKCLCVPPGTYGNKETCACYNNWKTKRGGPKCP